jgi:hypothetical protein
MAAAQESTMSSIYGRFPDARALLSLDTEQLAEIFFGYFRSLPWRQREPVARCLARAVDLYPDEEVRPALANALLDAWVWLETNGFLQRVESHMRNRKPAA